MKEQRVALGLLLAGFVLIMGFAAVTAYNDMKDDTATLSLTSAAFAAGERIPQQYSCDVEDPVSPPLSFGTVPEGTVSLALLVNDPDVPTEVREEGNFDHWVLFNVPADARGIEEGETAGTPGANGRGDQTYAPPCPPPQYEPAEHRYVFTLYALDTELDLEAGATREEVLAAMEGHVIQSAELIGRYERITH